jgi:C4-dicarboxylate-specific signal transduction histidine kinase
VADSEPAILFVEADADARRVIGRFLVRWGQVKAVGTLAEARVAIEQDGPELLVIDPELPDGDGLEAIGQARGRVPWVQVLVVSPAEQMHRMSAFIAAGAHDVVLRPFDIGMLEGRVLRLKQALPVRRLEVERIRQLEARVRHVDAIAMLGTVAATIAHELAGPLSAVMTNADMIESALSHRQVTADDQQHALQSVGDVKLATRMIQEFITRIRGHARAGAGSFVNESLASVLDTTRLFLRHKILLSRVRVRWPGPEELPVVNHVPTRLTQALTNAVANALEAVEAGGSVHVSCEQGPEAVALVVQDDGPGLSGEALAAALQPFHTTKPSGTGLGMSVISDVVREHGGELRFEAVEAGRGLRLKMLLPRTQ